MKEYQLFTTQKLGDNELKNRIVMAPITRCRATSNLPNDLMRDYYKQRADAGLIITEGTSPSPNGLGYLRMPGIYSLYDHVEGWDKITSAVHERGGKIVVQLRHTGRLGHPLNMPEGSQILAPSALRATGNTWTDSSKLLDFPVPKAMTDEDLLHTKIEFMVAAMNAIAADFDGVELDSANGYLLEQFISPLSNIRKDIYGGSIINRCRFVLDVVASIAEIIGKENTGVRLSPFGVSVDMFNYPEIETTYEYLAEQLNNIGIAYIHLVDHSTPEDRKVWIALKRAIRRNFRKVIILSGGYDKDRAETDIQNGLCDLVSFGRPFINNPDLVERFKNDWPVSKDIKMDKFYTAGEMGYTDYPLYKFD